MNTSADKNYRYELKYEINTKDAFLLKQKLALIMDCDEFSPNEDGSYYIRSLYFDDIYNTAYHEKVNGAEFREKYRIRFYNFDANYILIELKGKNGNLCYKKQDKIQYQEYCDIMNKDYDKIIIEENKRETLRKFINDCKNKNLVPSIIVDYKRIAYTYPVANVRITFDSDIASGRFNYDIMNDKMMLFPVLEDDRLILEVKYNKFLPKIIDDILKTVPSVRISMSKFALCREMKGDV